MRSLQWDIFCKVIDNFGDVGICWRLAADLASRSQKVRLWVDDATALAWMAPEDCERLEVRHWTELLDLSCLEAAPCNILVEAFGCEIAPQFIAYCARFHWARGQNDVSGPAEPLWINLEYLSAEPYVARNHGLTSLVSNGPAAGWHKVFYYPGFTPDTGGLLREQDLASRQLTFDRKAWLKQQGIDWQGEKLVSLFCYEPPALAQLLDELARNGIEGQPVRLLVAAGRATQAVKALKTAQIIYDMSLQRYKFGSEQLSISYLPLLTQTEFDHLLWASDINFVRGEDSIVRSIWAGKPFVWQIYPQDDGVHMAKLDAFLEMMDAPPGLRAFHRAWNSLAEEVLPPLPKLTNWQKTANGVCTRLSLQPDLTAGLIKYVLKNR